jgi:hypothetical protein
VTSKAHTPAEQRLRRYEQAIARVESNQGISESERAFPRVLQLSPGPRTGPNVQFLFEEKADDVLGQIRIPRARLQGTEGERLKTELRRLRFVNVTSRSRNQRLASAAQYYEDFSPETKDDEARFIRERLPKDPGELASLAETLLKLLLGKRQNFTPAFEYLIPRQLRSGDRARKSWPVFPRGGGNSGPGVSDEGLWGLDVKIVTDGGDTPWNIETFDQPGGRSGGFGSAPAPPRAAEAPAAAAAAPPVAAAAAPDPPRSAYALLSAPDVVIAGVAFEVTVGISATAMPGVLGDSALQRPAWSQGPYSLVIQVIADGLSLQDGESWRHELPVNGDQPYPTVALHLTALPQEQPIMSRAVQAIYSIGGQTIGHAFRPVSVLRDASLQGVAPTPAPRPEVSVTVAPGPRPPDLTARITFAGPQSQGRLAWTFDSPAALALPEEALFCDLGANTDDFARQLVNEISALEGKVGIYDELKGRGVEIAKQVPAQFWELLRSVAKVTAPRPPTVLLLSAEPYVPWELAVVPAPLLDASAAPFLAAQATVGRWALSTVPPPEPLPPAEVRVSSVVVISGDYSNVLYAQDLPEARAEAAQIVAEYAGRPVAANFSDVLACIKGAPPAQLMHFAVHGKYDQSGALNGLLLIDGGNLRVLSDSLVSGVTLGGTAPFVFLNACQVGTGNEVLGNYAGMAAAFLNAGASAVIAPLWSVNDAIASQIALGFYDKVAAGAAPAEVLRRQRAQFTDSAATLSGTPLAYQFFGDPSMMLSIPKSTKEEPA